jgi:hypothetical protein
MTTTERTIHAVFWIGLIAGYLYIGLADPATFGMTR